jgi:predicted SnoaL-like aldol condensation-catalyzing enzyme
MKLTTAVIILGLICALPASAQSGRTAEEEANVALVLEFWRTVLQAGDVEKADNYYTEDMAQHNPNVPQGLAGFKAYFSSFNRPVEPVKDAVMGEVFTMVEGDLVTLMRVSSVPNPGDESGTYEAFSFDTFRVKDGMIVEHWDAARKAEN